MSKSLSVQNTINVTEQKGQVITKSRNVAEIFKKEHKHVMEAIRNCEASEEFCRSNFRLIEYLDSQNRKQPEYLMTRDGFTFIAMGFTGKEAAKFKEDYIKKFNEMEAIIHQKKTSLWQETRQTNISQTHQFTDAIQAYSEYAKSQGSKNYDKYYVHFMNLANKVCGIGTGQKNMSLNQALANQNIVMSMLINMMYSEISKGTPYKKGFKNCSEKISEIVALIQPQKSISN